MIFFIFWVIFSISEMIFFIKKVIRKVIFVILRVSITFRRVINTFLWFFLVFLFVFFTIFLEKLLQLTVFFLIAYRFRTRTERGIVPYLKLKCGDYSLFQVIFPLRILCISGFFLMLSTW